MTFIQHTEKTIAEVFSSTDIKAMSPTAQRFAAILEKEGWIKVVGGEPR